jgi:hypothetical protein
MFGILKVKKLKSIINEHTEVNVLCINSCRSEFCVHRAMYTLAQSKKNRKIKRMKKQIFENYERFKGIENQPKEVINLMYNILK